jgi:transposase
MSEEEWAFVAPYFALLSLDARQRRHDLREVFNALRYLIRSGAPWRMLPNDFPPWEIVYQQTGRWVKAGVFETMVHDLRVLLRVLLRDLAWATRLRRLVRDYERLPETVRGFPFIAFACLMLHKAAILSP